MSNLIDQQVQDALELLNQKLHGNVDCSLFSELFDAVADIVVPEGYKLVPFEPTERMLDASRRRQWDDLSSPYEDMDMLKYKAMIGAVE